MSIKKQNFIIFLICLFICFLYFTLMLSFISIAYLDFGDGNYLYISQRINEGVVIYKDILTPQPPLHLFLGSLLLELGNLINNQLLLVRIFTILLRISHAVLIFFLSDRIFPEYKYAGLLASVIYLFLPIGFWWSRGYQTEPLQILFMLLTIFFFLKMTSKSMFYAGIFSGLGGLTNMTMYPYIVLIILFLLCFAYKEKKIKLFLSYFIPFLSLVLLTTLLLSWYTQGMFLQNVIFDQVGTYPKENTFSYMIGKVKWIGSIILKLEGTMIILALYGIYLFCRKTKSNLIYFSCASLGSYFSKNERKILGSKFVFSKESFLIIYSITTLASFLFATKGGTVDYIFTLAEPTIALFSSYAFFKLFSNSVHRLISGILLMIILFSPAIKQNIETLRGVNYELDENKVTYLISLIEEYTGKEDEILAPPYLAFLSGRRLVNEYSEHFIWFIKYLNFIKYRVGKASSLKTIYQIADKINRKEIKLIIFNNNRTKGQQLPLPIWVAIMQNYRPIVSVAARNEDLCVYLPL